MATIHNVHTHSKTEKPGPVPAVIHAPFEIPDFEGAQELPAQAVVIPQTNSTASNPHHSPCLA